MYTILIKDDNTMEATQKQRIIQRSKLVDDFQFLVSPIYNGIDFSSSTVLLEYVKPISKKYKTEILALATDMYKDYLVYTLPVDTEFTQEAGRLEMQLSFIYLDMDPDGTLIQKVRKIAPAIRVDIIPVSAWADIVPDEALSPIDQRIIIQNAQIKALDEITARLDDIQNSGGSCDCLADGVPVVTFGIEESDIQKPEEDNVIEF